MVYVALFYFVVGTIMLNMVLSIIVDTFGRTSSVVAYFNWSDFRNIEIRENQKEAKHALSTACFICSLDRDTFQSRAKG